MSGAQHLIENAIICIEEGKSYEDFLNASGNKIISSATDIELKYVWDMAMHVVYTLKSSWVSDTLAVLRGATPFDLKMRDYVERFI
jgi:hypothetical protein